LRSILIAQTFAKLPAFYWPGIHNMQNTCCRNALKFAKRAPLNVVDTKLIIARRAQKRVHNAQKPAELPRDRKN
jgi:hypothetical protein